MSEEVNVGRVYICSYIGLLDENDRLETAKWIIRRGYNENIKKYPGKVLIDLDCMSDSDVLDLQAFIKTKINKNEIDD